MIKFIKSILNRRKPNKIKWIDSVDFAAMAMQECENYAKLVKHGLIKVGGMI